MSWLCTGWSDTVRTFVYKSCKCILHLGCGIYYRCIFCGEIHESKVLWLSISVFGYYWSILCSPWHQFRKRCCLSLSPFASFVLSLLCMVQLLVVAFLTLYPPGRRFLWQACTPRIFNPRPAGRLRPSGEFCEAREGYFTKYNVFKILKLE